MATRWGICGAGKISWDFTTSLITMPDEHQVVAVADRELERAQTYATDLKIAKSYGSAEEMAKDPNVEVVYIGTIHPVHHKQTLLFLNHGKHVLVEKPASLNLKQLKEMTSLAKEKKLFFMEGAWSRFFPLYERLITELASGTIGEPKLLNIHMVFPIADVPRIREKALGGGGLMDIGVYPIHIAIFLFGRPDKVSIQATMLETGVDEAGCITFKYKDGRMAQLSYSVTCQLSSGAVICGTKGKIKVHSLICCPTELTLPSGKVTFDLPKSDAKFNFFDTIGFVYEAQHVRKCIMEGKTESPYLPVSHSEYVMGLLDHLRAEIGLRYEADD